MDLSWIYHSSQLGYHFFWVWSSVASLGLTDDLIPKSLWSSGSSLRMFVAYDLPSGYVKIAIENCHRNSGFSHWKWWFSIVTLVYQRVHTHSRSYSERPSKHRRTLLRCERRPLPFLHFWRRCFRFGVRTTLGGLSGLDGRRFLGCEFLQTASLESVRSWWTPDIRIVGYSGIS